MVAGRSNVFNCIFTKFQFLEENNAAKLKLIALLNNFISLYFSLYSGFADGGEFWRSSYDDSPNFEDTLIELWATVAPLYRQLHAYVRRKLVERYGEERVRSDGPIPAHLLGKSVFLKSLPVNLTF